MHLTEIILKDGRKFSAPIETIKFDPDIFEYSYIKLFNSEELFYIQDIKSAKTKKDRISCYKFGDVDEIKRMRNLWNKYKKGEIKSLI